MTVLEDRKWHLAHQLTVHMTSFQIWEILGRKKSLVSTQEERQSSLLWTFSCQSHKRSDFSRDHFGIPINYQASMNACILNKRKHTKHGRPLEEKKPHSGKAMFPQDLWSSDKDPREAPAPGNTSLAWQPGSHVFPEYLTVGFSSLWSRLIFEGHCCIWHSNPFNFNHLFL